MPAVETPTRPASDVIEVLLTPSPGLYSEMGADIAAIRERLDLAPSVSNTQVIAEALRSLAENNFTSRSVVSQSALKRVDAAF